MEDVRKHEADWSTAETMPDLEVGNEAQEDQNLKSMTVTTTTLLKPAVVGIGVEIRTWSHDTTESWALKDRSHGNKNTDAAAAIRLVLCKALQRGWRNIKVRVQNKEAF